MTKTRYVLIPVPPTKKMLAGMSNATFLTDGSDTEMHRRFNGMLENLPKRKKNAPTRRVAR